MQWSVNMMNAAESAGLLARTDIPESGWIGNSAAAQSKQM